jgi:hypothetical protein
VVIKDAKLTVICTNNNSIQQPYNTFNPIPIYNLPCQQNNSYLPTVVKYNVNRNSYLTPHSCLYNPNMNPILYPCYCNCGINYSSTSTADISYTGADFYTQDPYYGYYYTLNNVQNVNNGLFGLWNYDIRGRYTGSYYLLLRGSYRITMTYDNVSVGLIGETYTIYPRFITGENEFATVVYSRQVNGGTSTNISGSIDVTFGRDELPIVFGIFAINDYNGNRTLVNINFSSIQITRIRDDTNTYIY